MQFSFFIVKFEWQGFKVYKNFAIIVCKVMFELNRILLRIQDFFSTKIIQIKVYVRFVNDTFINLGVIRSIFNKEKMAILFTYDQNIAFYNIQTEHQHDDVKNILDLIVYL